ncbi:hypothetical protein DPV25_08000 [Escherichia coli]|nr:hypothetical protein [Escherichia coli]EFO2969091.1 hypothetical protein [Escherichia coli]EFO3222574.1 hypothetical protein [Escherichia coli]EGE1325788.1 hypothetical protein [Escherichia coli]
MSIPLPRILVRLTVSVSLSLMKPRAKIGDYVMVLQKITEKEAISGKGISPTNTSGYKYYCAAGVLAGC